MASKKDPTPWLHLRGVPEEPHEAVIICDLCSRVVLTIHLPINIRAFPMLTKAMQIAHAHPDAKAAP